MSIDAIQQAARETLERHQSWGRIPNDPWCRCGVATPCPDYVAMERIVHAADALATEHATAYVDLHLMLDALAATHEKIREHAEDARRLADRYVQANHPSTVLSIEMRQITGHAEAILALLPQEETT